VADSARGDADQRVPRPDAGNREVLENQRLANLVGDGDSHGGPQIGGTGGRPPRAAPADERASEGSLSYVTAAGRAMLE